MSCAFVFPGQGSQFIGMGKDLFDRFAVAKETFQEVDNALDQKLSELIFSGDEKDLNLTENTQPALMAVSMAVINVLKAEAGFSLTDYCSYVAGHSLGEYSALTAAGALTLSDSAKLLKHRGQAMQSAVPVGKGSMAAILGLDLPEVQSIVEKANADNAETNSVCQTANDNSVGQVVVSGHQLAVERAVNIASESGAKRAVILPVSAPFHCALMSPAADSMKQALQDVSIQSPCVPVIANVTAQPEQDPDKIRDLLVQQVTGMVRWRESVLWMGENGVTEMVEIGAGKVLNGLARRINKDISCQSVGTVEQVEDFMKALS